jgi:hypothetical protein
LVSVVSIYTSHSQPASLYESCNFILREEKREGFIFMLEDWKYKELYERRATRRCKSMVQCAKLPLSNHSNARNSMNYTLPSTESDASLFGRILEETVKSKRLVLELSSRVEVKGSTYVIRSFLSLSFFRPPKAILVPGMYFLGFSR